MSSQKPRFWTAVQHSSVLLVALGVFVTVSAWMSQSESNLIRFGTGLGLLGLLGIVAGGLGRSRSSGK